MDFRDKLRLQIAEVNADRNSISIKAAQRRIKKAIVRAQIKFGKQQTSEPQIIAYGEIGGIHYAGKRPQLPKPGSAAKPTPKAKYKRRQTVIGTRPPRKVH